MTALRTDGFSGLAPIFDARKLPLGAATLARNGKFDGTDFRPLRAHAAAGQPLGFAVARLFKYRFHGQSHWLAWPAPYVVDVANSPIPQDDLGRLYWTRVNPAGLNDAAADNYPRVASEPTQLAVTANSPGTIRRLGIPQPTEAPSLSVQAALMMISTDSTPPGITGMSQSSPVTVTAPGHPFKNGQTVMVTSTTDGGSHGVMAPGPIVNAQGGDTNAPEPPEAPDLPPGGVEPAPTGPMAQLLGANYVVAHSTADTFDMIGADGSTAVAFTADAHLAISRVYGIDDVESRSYVYTYVSDWGEEGPPSPPCDPQDIRYDATVFAYCDLTAADWARLAINRVRIYRTASGTSSTDFYFVAEAPIGIESTVSVTDDKEPEELGELLPSTSWTPPPNGLQGLVAMPNGFLAGFKDNTLYFSEPYMPHAWPDAYCKTTQDDIVGLGVYGQTLVVATTRKPYIASGADPASVTLAQLDMDAPCLAKSGLCSVGSAVVYPTPQGVAYVSAATASIVTLAYITRRQWVDLWSPTMDAVFHDNRYIAFSRETGKRTLILERHGDGSLAISDTDTYGRAPAVDPDDDTLNFILVEGASATKRYVWEGGTAPMQGIWRGRVWTQPHAVSLAMGQVFASGYPLTLTVSYANLGTSGQPGAEVTDSFTVTVAGPEPFRLPGGFLSREWQAQLTSTAAVQGMVLTDNADDVRQQ